MRFPGLTPRVRLRHHAHLTPPVHRAKFEVAGMGPAGEALTVWRDDASVMVSVTVQAPPVSHQVRTTKPLPSVRFAQPLSEGRIVLVEGWADRQHNAWVLDADGEILHRANVGGWVDEVHTSTSDAVWIGYGDQGIYDDGPRSNLTSRGLARFSDSLRPQWLFDNGADRVMIDHCESINIDQSRVWTCPYAEYPVVRIEGDRVAAWCTPKEYGNIGAVLVHQFQDRVAMVATGWSHRPGLSVIGQLGDGVFDEQAAVVLRMPDGAPLPAKSQLVGRGAELHVLVGADWYRTDLDQLTTPR